MNLRRTTGALLFFILYAASSSAQSFRNDEGYSSINSTKLINYIRILTSIKFDGRLPGSEGFNRAASFAAGKFREYRLEAKGDSGYFQFFKIEYNKIDTPAVLKMISGKREKVFIHGKDFVLRGFTGSADTTLPVAFCGYGLSRPDLGYDDYKGINVKDKIVIVFKQNPGWKINDKDWGNGYPREKSKTAYDHGAKGILFVSTPNDEKPQGLIGSVLHGDGEQLEDFPQLQITEETADFFFNRVNITLKEIQTSIDEKKNPWSFLTRTNARIKVKAEYNRNVKTMNVVGEIIGTDPEYKNEYLVIGAHLDHVGSQAGLLFPGANDNASGSAGVLALAEAFKLSKIKPKRSIIFVLFAGEEQGLNGAEYFVKNLGSNTSKIVAMFNLDCIGYGDSIQIGNGKSSPELWKIANQIDKENFNLMVKDTWSGGGADATPFYNKGIPCAYFVSHYSYDHLHQTSDTVETLNPGLLENIVKLVYLSARKVADGEYKRESVIR